MIEAEFSGARGAFRLDARFAAPGGGVTALFGPSGCGKTSVLRCVAGLDRLPGRLVVNGETWQAGRRFRPVHRRALGYVFQEASLFPHLGVRENLMFGARRAKGAPGVSVDEAIALLGLEKLFSRTVAQLSGGERQRVAIGRALLSQPRLLLMDEPLSALDRFSKDEILPYLERLHGALSIPVLYVSHDIEEVERLADTLILMEAGRVRAAGPAAEILSDPALPLARAARPASVLDGHVVSVDAGYGLTTVQVAGARLIAPGLLGAPGAPARLRVRAEEVSLGRAAPVDTTILNAVPARILSAGEAGEGRMGVRLGLGTEGSGARLLAQVSRLSWDRLGLRVGEVVIARIKASAVEGPGLRQAAGEAPQARASAATGAVAAAQR